MNFSLTWVHRKKVRAQFEVHPLKNNGNEKYLEEVMKCSSAAMDMLNILHGEAEDVRNAHTCAVYPRGVPFWQHYPDADNECFSITLTTDPLVQNIPDPSHSSVLRLKHGDIGKGDSMYSPCKQPSHISYHSKLINSKLLQPKLEQLLKPEGLLEVEVTHLPQQLMGTTSSQTCLKVLPVAFITASTMVNGLPDKKGKQKAMDEGDNAHSAKKVCDGEQTDDAEGTKGRDRFMDAYAMQISRDSSTTMFNLAPKSTILSNVQ
ncbi:hypothetical protein DEU56DRAFT_912045 [Suillus clintonianus]|uniref:uncharacterized protein n=1 Tax=Suillus clintonianus TaxID=1904413 RepID=UPI001B880468|nr:uncharacterized protein DEU56DRAFT_912045 [Suillus clintonianus]KAG2139778.1 hypothetical protein DEU56DRAFT_912045 [Suillus clintonianus]